MKISVKHIMLAVLMITPSVLALQGFQALGFSEWAAGWFTVPVMVANLLVIEKVLGWYRQARSQSAPTPHDRTPYRK